MNVIRLDHLLGTFAQEEPQSFCSGLDNLVGLYLTELSPAFSESESPPCCPSMIMSPFVLDRNVPLIGLPRGGPIGADTDEQAGVGTSGSIGAGAQQTTAGR